MEEVLPFSCVNLTIYSAKKTKQNKTKTKKKKKTTIQHERHVKSALTSVLACKKIGRLDVQSMDVRKSKRERAKRQ